MKLPLVRIDGESKQSKIDMGAVDGLSDALTITDTTHIAQENQDTFPIEHNGQPLVYTNGVLLGAANYDASDLTEIVFNEPLRAGDIVRVLSLKGKLVSLTGLALVAHTGSYSDLSNKPSIPDPQVNADWNATTGKAQILNKPSLGTAATKNITVSTSNPSGGSNGDVWFKV